MEIIDAHMAALVKIGGSNELDWYGILQVEPTVDKVAVKKQYTKLALLLHPDKNKLIGIEFTFKIIGEALQVLWQSLAIGLWCQERHAVSKDEG